MPCCAALRCATGQEHQAEKDRGKCVVHAVCGGQSVEIIGRACCAASSQSSKLVSCDDAVDVATQASVHKCRDMHDQTCLAVEVRGIQL